MFFGSKKLIGLDIGTSSIKIAELEAGRGGYTLNAFGFAPTPVGAVNAGEILAADAVAMAVRGLASEIKTKSKYASVGMSGTSVIVKRITIPKMEKKLIADQIKWEAEQYIPFDINDISLAYHVLKSRASAESLDILLVAAQNEIVSRYLNVVTGSGFKLGVLDVSGFALANIFEANYGRISGETVALLNVGAAVTNFVVVNNGEVVFSRDIPIGGGAYTNEVHKEMGITLAEAESLKISAAMGNEAPEQVQAVIAATNDVVTDEIRNSFEFFMASNSDTAITRGFITGGAASMPGLVQQISKAAAVPIEMLNPFIKVKASKKNFNPEYLIQIAPFVSVAMGLGLRKVGDS